MVHNVWASPVVVARVEVLALTGEKTRQLDDFVGGLATILFTPGYSSGHARPMMLESEV